LEFGVSVFVEGERPENPEKNPWSKDDNQQQTQPTYVTRPELNLGHIGGRQALSPLHHPSSPQLPSLYIVVTILVFPLAKSSLQMGNSTTYRLFTNLLQCSRIVNN